MQLCGLCDLAGSTVLVLQKEHFILSSSSSPSSANRKIFIVLYNPKKLDYNAWQAQCRLRQGELAVIDSVVEQDMANSIIKPLPGAVLIGPRRSSSNINNFVTKDGKTLKYT